MSTVAIDNFNVGLPDPATLACVDGWPARHDLFGVKVSATCYDQVVEAVIRAARAGRGGLVDFMPVNVLVEAARNQRFRAMINSFDIVAPDGQPVRWALNKFHGCGLTDRVYGPFLMKFLCAAAAREKISVYLYGGAPEALTKLEARLKEWFPDLIIAGAWSPPFRPLTPQEDAEATDRINASGAGIVFLGIGSPRQEVFAFEHRQKIKAVQLCVGAAFDFHAGVKRMAPAWMQKRGLEWLFRLVTEPRRLGKRYFCGNAIYTCLCIRRLIISSRY
jgi:exopolysaccharide biosynthesis WecB/TagA/CpsF family protein